MPLVEFERVQILNNQTLPKYTELHWKIIFTPPAKELHQGLNQTETGNLGPTH